MTEQTNTELVQREAVCTIPGCPRPAEDTSFPGCREHRAAFDAKGREEAWDLVLGILGPWVEATRRIGSEELTRVMESALGEGEREYGLALDELESAEARLRALERREEGCS